MIKCIDFIHLYYSEIEVLEPNSRFLLSNKEELLTLFFKNASFNSLRLTECGYLEFKKIFTEYVFSEKLSEKSKFYIIIEQRSRAPWYSNDTSLILFDEELHFDLTISGSLDSLFNLK